MNVLSYSIIGLIVFISFIVFAIKKRISGIFNDRHYLTEDCIIVILMSLLVACVWFISIPIILCICLLRHFANKFVD
jgi:hypothetical protein